MHERLFTETISILHFKLSLFSYFWSIIFTSKNEWVPFSYYDEVVCQILAWSRNHQPRLSLFRRPPALCSALKIIGYWIEWNVRKRRTMRLWNLDRVKNELLFNCNSPVHVAKENLNKKQTDLDYLISLLYCCCPMVLLWKAVRALRCGELKPFVIHVRPVTSVERLMTSRSSASRQFTVNSITYFEANHAPVVLRLR